MEIKYYGTSKRLLTCYLHAVDMHIGIHYYFTSMKHKQNEVSTLFSVLFG